MIPPSPGPDRTPDPGPEPKRRHGPGTHLRLPSLVPLQTQTPTLAQVLSLILTRIRNPSLHPCPHPTPKPNANLKSNAPHYPARSPPAAEHYGVLGLGSLSAHAPSNRLLLPCAPGELLQRQIKSAVSLVLPTRGG